MRKLHSRNYPDPKRRPALSYRQRYARKFNTFAHNVAYWHELPLDLRASATVQFSDTNMADHVYHIGGKLGSRRVISRRMRDFGDTGKPETNTAERPVF